MQNIFETYSRCINNITTKETSLNGLILIDEIRTELNTREAIPISDNEFSKQYLDRSRSYISVIRHKQLDISEPALLALYRNLNGLAVTWKAIAESSSMPTSSSTWQNYLFFERLSEMVWKGISIEKA